MARILVVEDDALVGRSVARQLMGLHDVTIVHNVDDALEMHAMEPYDLVLADIVMPGKSGIDLYEVLVKRGEAHRVMFVTGAAASPRISGFLSGVPNRWVEKPCTREALIAAVQSELAKLGPR